MSDIPEAPRTPALPRLNEPAPDFTATTTQGVISLGDYRGTWVVQFSHPADFTPVCSTELLAFAKHEDAFAQPHAQRIGLSPASSA